MRHIRVDLRALGSHVAEGTLAIIGEHHDLSIPPPAPAGERRIYHRSDEAIARRQVLKSETASRGRRASPEASA